MRRPVSHLAMAAALCFAMSTNWATLPAMDQPGGVDAQAIPADATAAWYFSAFDALRAGNVTPANIMDHMAILASDSSPENVALAAELLCVESDAGLVPNLKAILSSSDEFRVLAAMDVLGSISADSATLALIDCLGSDSNAVVINAIGLLSRRHNPAVAAALVECVRHDDKGVAIAAIDALGELPIPAAAEALKSLNPSEVGMMRSARQRSIVRVAGHETSGALNDELLAIMKTGENSGVRIAAFRALARNGSDRSFEAMVDALHDSSSDLHNAALLAVAQGLFPGRTADMASDLAGLESAVAASIVDALGQRGDSAAWPKVSLLLVDAPEELRLAALRATARIAPPEAVLDIAQSVAHSPVQLRSTAINALAGMEGAAAQQQIERLLATENVDSEVLTLLTEVAGTRRLSAATDELLALAQSDDFDLRRAALTALRDVANPEAAPALANYVATAASTADRRRAADALAASALNGDAEESAATIIQAMDGADLRGREELLTVLGQLGAPSALPVLRDAAAGLDASLRRAAIRALGNWPDAGPVGFLAQIAGADDDDAIRRLAARSIINMARGQSEPDTRWSIIDTVAELPLDVAERRLLVAAVTESMDKPAIEWLVARLDDPELVPEVQAAIVTIALDIAPTDHQIATAALEAASKSGESELVRKAMTQLAPSLGPENHLLVWDLSGPYQLADGEQKEPMAVSFAPESPGEGEWRMIKGGRNPEVPWLVDLESLVEADAPDAVAYLRTWFLFPRNADAAFEIGSNGPVAMWLNGNEILRTTTTRPIAPLNDQVVAPLIVGTNELTVKLQRGSDGWGFAMRVAELPGQSLEGLMVKGDGNFMMDLPTVPASDTAAEEPAPPPVWSTERWEGDPFFGDYQVSPDDDHTIPAAQVIPLGNDRFRIQLLPAFDTPDAPNVALDATPEGDTLIAQGEGWQVIVADHTLTAAHETHGDITMSHVVRKSPTLGSPPPEDAIVLFDGSNFDEWVGEAGGEVTWSITPEGFAQVTPQTGGIITKRTFEDVQLHLEFRAPYSPGNEHQFNGNSGVFLQVAYEVQVLANYGSPGLINECGAFYNLYPPAVNMCYPPLSWQTYDILFRAARFDEDGDMTSPAVAVVLHNGVLIHEMQELPETTIPDDSPPNGPRPLYLQDHHNQVQYRNIWIQPLENNGE